MGARSWVMRVQSVFTIFASLFMLALSMAGEDAFLKGASWDHLLADTGTAAIVIPPGSVTEEAACRQHLAWIERWWLNPELERLKGAADEAKLQPILAFAARGLAGLERNGVPPEMAKAAAETLKAELRRPATDYLLAALLEKGPYAAVARDAFAAVASAKKDGTCPLMLRLLAQARVLSHADHFTRNRVGEEQKRFMALLAENVSIPRNDEETRWLVRWHLDSPISGVRWNREQQFIQIYQKSKLSEWARLTLTGAVQWKWGWRLVGHGWGTPVVPDAGKKLDEHVAQARKDLARAWELRPGIVWAPEQMLGALEIGGHDALPEMRVWLDRVMAVECDHRVALRIFLDASLPSWHGRFSETLAFGKACADTGRYDSQLPTYFNEAVSRIAADLDDWTIIYGNPDVAALLRETRRKRAEKAAGTVCEKEQWSLLLFESWILKDYAGAAKAVEHLRLPVGIFVAEETRSAAARLNVHEGFALRDLLLRGGEKTQGDYGRGIAEMEHGNFGAAREAFQAALPNADEWGKSLLDAEVKRADFQEKYDSGEWTRVPLEQRFCWTDLEGDMTWRAEQKHLRLSSTWEFSKTLFRGRLGADFEARGHFTHSRPGQREERGGGLGIYMGHTPLGSGRHEAFWWTLRVDSVAGGKSLVQFAPKYDAGPDREQKKSDTKDDMSFHFQRTGARVQYSLGGRELVHDAKLDDDAPGGENAFGFGVLGRGEGSWAEVWDVEVRRIKRDKPLPKAAPKRPLADAGPDSEFHDGRLHAVFDPRRMDAGHGMIVRGADPQPVMKRHGE